MPTVVITGGTGLIGTRLSHLLKEQGFQVAHLSRRENLKATFPAYHWNPATGDIDPTPLLKADHIIMMAGAGIIDKPWTNTRKKELIASRVDGNLLIAQAVKAHRLQPKSIVAASAIGYYGNKGDQLLRENDQPGQGFLSECTLAWEESLNAFEHLDIRLTKLRIGIVLSTLGGALEKLALSFNFGTGNYFGKGGQYYSWIHIDDMCRMIEFAMKAENVTGTYNAVGPEPATLKTLIYAIKAAKKSNALIFPVPEMAIKLALGQRAAMILGSMRISSQAIAQAGFQFKFPELIPALEDLIARKI